MKEITITTTKRTEFIDITARVRQAIRDENIQSGACVLFVPHTTAAVTINENADPNVLRDLGWALEKLIPVDMGFHHAEGNSDSHLKSSLFGCTQYVIVENGEPQLGVWQALYFCEFDGPRTRKLWVQFVGK
jgi:secondary thiamine-phosphate synthase enzyme